MNLQSNFLILLEGGSNSLISPDPGLFFWTVLIFLILWFLLGKMAFGPIAKALRERENKIQGALDAAKEAEARMQALQAENEKIIAEAKEERTAIVREAKETAQRMVDEAKGKASDA